MPALKFVRSVWESFRASSGLEPRLLDSLRVTHASPGRVKFELDIKKEHTNRLNILHGGTIASMVDLGGSLAVASRGLFATGVSTDLNVTYLSSGGKIGDLIKAEVSCDKFGKTLAFTSIQFKNSQDQVFARGSHTKYIALAFKDHRNVVEELTPKSEKKV
ncbi:putative PaaI_thioesterase family protein [Lentithecium fluviatile CBS 122367]|uniref:Putative PaaI_thioesterase family protein n=1 Tax=Lentithecium fluviatile CBS 122367 TaxID=1168545 RepID=A0A6G1JA40_9PLEO|nr:putative PaaI_thioesterase family protein [Lentithecium fluviatile CBS 122367]